MTEASARKQRSLAILRQSGVPHIDHLPVIESEAESLRRTDLEVALRAMALAVVAAKGEGFEQDQTDELVDRFQLTPAFSPNELEFIQDPEPKQRDCIQFTWRYECYWVLLWALGFIEELAPPTEVCAVPKAVGILVGLGREGFLRQARLRPQHELLDAADLAYRYLWAVRNAQITNKEIPAGLEEGVVLERLHALNWLIGSGEDWDDVPTDT